MALPLLTVIVSHYQEDDDDYYEVDHVTETVEPTANVTVVEGYVHPKDCTCKQDGGRLCHVGWLEQVVNDCGVEQTFDIPDSWPAGASRVKFTGWIYSVEYDDYFEIESAEEWPHQAAHR